MGRSGNMRRRMVAFAVVLACMAWPAFAARNLSGQVDLVPGKRQKVALGEISEGVIYFIPAQGKGRAPRPSRFSVDTHSKGFLPATLVVPAGSVVAFPNRDQILHNVYSKSRVATFDLGTYGPGEVREIRLPRAGLVQVNCNVHQGMRANVLVLDTPHFVRPFADGRFQMSGVPEGEGTLVFWHPRAVAQAVPVTADRVDYTVRLRAVRARIGAGGTP